jgi:hypothetical protein
VTTRLVDHRASCRFGDEWLAFTEGPDDDALVSASGASVVQALSRLADRLRERRGSATG